MSYKSVLFGVVIGASVVLLGTAKAWADTLTFTDITVTEGQSGTITGSFTNTSSNSEMVQLVLQLPVGPPGDTSDGIVPPFDPPTFTCAANSSCLVSIGFDTGVSKGETENADSGTTTLVYLAFNASNSTAPPLTGFSAVDVTVNDATPLPAALPLFATGIGGLGLLGWCRKRKARAIA